MEYLRGKSASIKKEPWALYVGLLYPHWPFTVPKKYFDLYYPDNIQMPYDFVIPENPNLHPEIAHFQKAQNLTDLKEDDIKRALAAYYGMITAMDDMIGMIINELEQSGMLENTYIIYTSDHGDSAGEHGLFYKQCSYEGSVGVPLILAGPGIPAGHTVEQPVSLVDMYPTILDFAGLDLENDRLGVSWKQIANGKNIGREYVFAEYHGNFFRKDWYMLTNDQYKYTYYVGDRSTLFDVENDPHEMQDLANLPEYKEILHLFEAKLREILDPESVSLRSKKDLGLISPDGEDYTQTLTMQDLEGGYRSGRFAFEPEVPPYREKECEGQKSEQMI